MPATAAAQLPSTTDPRATLSAGLDNAGTASHGLDLLAHVNKPPGWFNPSNPGDFAFPNSDIAFQGNYAFFGSFNGFNILDITNPAAPSIKTSVVCPGGQGDLSVYKNLLFMSVEETRAKKDCTLTPAADATTRFRGVRIFDISNIEAPVQVGQVQTCRGSHTHTLVRPKNDANNVYIYVTGTGGVRPAAELAGCDNGGRDDAEPVAVADRGHQGPARRARDRRGRERAAPVQGRGDRCASTACRTRRRRRCIRPAWPGARRRTRTPATTSRSTRSSTSPPAPARATAC